jgi:hypothetical protein
VKRVIDFDSIEEWEADFRAALSGCVTDATICKMARSNLEFVEDTRDLLLDQADRDEVNRRHVGVDSIIKHCNVSWNAPG